MSPDINEVVALSLGGNKSTVWKDGLPAERGQSAPLPYFSPKTLTGEDMANILYPTKHFARRRASQ
jgi:hypothetical protein